MLNMKFGKLVIVLALSTVIAYVMVILIFAILLNEPIDRSWSKWEVLRTIMPVSGAYVTAIIAFTIGHRHGLPDDYNNPAYSLYVLFALAGPVVFVVGALVISIGPELGTFFGADRKYVPAAVSILAAVSASLQAPFIADLFGDRVANSGES